MLLRRLALAVLALLLLSAPAGAQTPTPTPTPTSTPSATATPGPKITTICHYTGDPQQPYVQLTLDPAGLDDHIDHDQDVIPAPALGCPTLLPPVDTSVPTATATPVPPAAALTICHATGRPVRYQTLVLEPTQVEAHFNHERDLIPAPAAGCPRRPASTGDTLPTKATPTPTPAPRRRSRTTAPRAAAAPASATATATPEPTLAGSSLPYTGGDGPLVALMGIALVMLGSGVRLRLRAARG